MADDVADVGDAAGLDDGVGEDGEDFAFVGEFGGDEAGFCCEVFWFWRRWRRGLGRAFVFVAAICYGIILHREGVARHPTECTVCKWWM